MLQEILVHGYGNDIIAKTLSDRANLLTPESRAYTFEVENIELSPEETSESSKGHPAVDREVNPWLGVAKLLEGVEKSYDKGKKLLDESRESGLKVNKSGGLTNGEVGASSASEIEIIEKILL